MARVLPVLEALLEVGAARQLVRLGSLGKELGLDQVLEQHAPPRSRRKIGDLAANLGLGQVQDPIP